MLTPWTEYYELDIEQTESAVEWATVLRYGCALFKWTYLLVGLYVAIWELWWLMGSGYLRVKLIAEFQLTQSRLEIPCMEIWASPVDQPILKDWKKWSRENKRCEINTFWSWLRYKTRKDFPVMFVFFSFSWSSFGKCNSSCKIKCQRCEIKTKEFSVIVSFGNNGPHAMSQPFRRFETGLYGCVP